jgi:uncharacterized protein
MKKLLIGLFALILFVQPVFAATSLPEHNGYINDFEGILNNKTELEAKVYALEQESSIEIAIVTVADFSDTTLEDYAVKLFEKWGIGKKKTDNGLLIIVSSKQRQSRIEVGYGLEGTLPDALTGRIQDEFMIPAFKNNDYSKGIADGLDQIIAIIKKDPTALKPEDAYVYAGTTEESSGVAEWLVTIVFFGIYIMALTKSWWFGGLLGFFVGLVWAFSTGVWLLPPILTGLGLLLDFLLSKTPVGQALLTVSKYAVLSSGGSRSSGGGGGSSFGGSFGGGSSGGGGSSRSW